MPEERKKERKKQVITTIIGILAIFITLLIIISVIGSKAPAKQLIMSTIELRTAEDSVRKSQLISNIDKHMLQATNPALTEQWNKVLNCIGKGCPDEAYSDTIFVICSEYKKDLPQSEIIINTIVIKRFWDDPEKVLEFSKAMTQTDKTISDTGNRKLIKTWSDILKCNGKCEEKNDLFFQFIDEIIRHT